MKKLLIFGLMCLMLTSQALAFSFFGMKLFEKQPAWGAEPKIELKVIEPRMSEEKRLEKQPMVDIQEALALANADERAVRYMSNFEGENFCFVSDVREAYFTIKDSKAVELTAKPTSCHVIRGKEGYAIGLMNKYKAKERVPASEVLQNIETSFMLKLKVMSTLGRQNDKGN
jgi:hypothetical protein